MRKESKLPLFTIPESKPKVTKQNEKSALDKLKLKRGESILELIDTARKMVLEKLGGYITKSKCITTLEDLKKFFDETEENADIGIDTETTRLIRAEYKQCEPIYYWV